MSSVRLYNPSLKIDVTIFNSPYYFDNRAVYNINKVRRRRGILGNNIDDVPSEVVIGYGGVSDVFQFMNLYQQDAPGTGDETGSIVTRNLEASQRTSLASNQYPYIIDEHREIVNLRDSTSSGIGEFFGSHWGVTTFISMWPFNHFSFSGFISNRLMLGFGHESPGNIIFSAQIGDTIVRDNDVRNDRSLTEFTVNPLNPLIGGANNTQDIIFTPLFTDIITLISNAFSDFIIPSASGRGFSEVLRFEEGEVNIRWVSSISFSLWIGTDVGSFAITKVNANSFLADLLVNPERDTDQGSQENSAPVILERILLQISDTKQFVYVIQDSEELRRKITDTVTRRVELDYFTDDNIKSISTAIKLGYVFILMESGKLLMGVIRQDDVAFGEWEFEASVKDMGVLGNDAFFLLNNKKIVRVNLTGDEEIEPNVPLTFETHSPPCYFLNYVFSEADQDPIGDLGGGTTVIKQGKLYGKYQCEEIGIGTREGGVENVIGKEILGLTFDDNGNLTGTAEGNKYGSSIDFEDVDTNDEFSGIVFYFKGRKRKVDLICMFVHIPR